MAKGLQMKHARKIYMTTALVLALAFAGCNQNEKTTEAPAPAETKVAAAPVQETKEAAPPAEAAAPAPAAQPAPAAAEQASLSGTVVETFDSGGYTYIQLDDGAKKIWAAVGQTKVAVGDKISLQNGPVMSNFHSKTLDRTFPEIIFSSGIAGGAAAAAPAGGAPSSFTAAVQSEGAAMPPAAGMGAEDAASGGSTKAVTPLQEIKVEKAEGENGYQVGEVFSSAGDLAGKKVKVRGKVVKVSPNIMGRTWVHLQDGTGNAASNTHDLVVTSAEAPELNSVVVAEGELAKDKDFGSGYFYNVIVEGATFSK
jgi:hypothetical protein